MPTPAVQPTRTRRHWLLLLSLGVVALLLAACAGLPPAIQIALSSLSQAVIRGDSVEIVVTLTRTGGANAPVTLTLSGLPVELTHAFVPAILDGDVLTSTLTIQADASAAEGVGTVTVSADSGALSAQADLQLEVASLTITGKVVAAGDLPYSGLVVGMMGNLTVTDADGRFTLNGLSVPYTLYVASLANAWVHAFEGLRAAELRIEPQIGGITPPPGLVSYSATVTGQLLGGAVLPADQAIVICAEGLNGIVYGCEHGETGDTSYGLNLAWLDPAEQPVRLHALHVNYDAGGLPIGYLGYQAIDVVLGDGDAAVRNLSLAALDTELVDLSYEAPWALGLEFLGMVRFGPNLGMVVGALDSYTEFSFPVPVLPGVSLDAVSLATATNSGTMTWRTGLQAGPLEIAVQAPPEPALPADGAVGVDADTAFAITPLPGMAKTFVFTAASSGDVSIAVTTMRDTIRLSDLEGASLGFEPNASYDWLVRSTEFSDVESAAAGPGLVSTYTALLFAVNNGGPPAPGPGSLAISPTRTFTAAP